MSESTATSIHEGWTKLKDAFRETCESINARPHCYELECVEPNQYQFLVNRLHGGARVSALVFHFQPSVPRIQWVNHVRSYVGSEGILGLRVSGSHVSYTEHLGGIVLDEFVTRLMMAVCR